MDSELVNTDYRKLPCDTEERLQMLLNCALCDVNYALLNRQDFDHHSLKAILRNDLYRAVIYQKIADNCRKTLQFYANVGITPDPEN